VTARAAVARIVGHAYPPAAKLRRLARRPGRPVGRCIGRDVGCRRLARVTTAHALIDRSVGAARIERGVDDRAVGAGLLTAGWDGG
jgi:hypothetical protein